MRLTPRAPHLSISYIPRSPANTDAEAQQDVWSHFLWRLGNAGRNCSIPSEMLSMVWTVNLAKKYQNSRGYAEGASADEWLRKGGGGAISVVVVDRDCRAPTSHGSQCQKGKAQNDMKRGLTITCEPYIATILLLGE